MHEKIIAKKLELLAPRAVLSAEEIAGWDGRLATYRAPGVYDAETAWAPWNGDPGIPALKTVFLRTFLDMPPPAHPDATRWIEFRQQGLEALVSLDQTPYAGLDANHPRIPAPPPGRYALEIEGMAQLRAYCQPELKGSTASFSGGRILEVDPDIQGLILDLQFLWQAAMNTSDSYRGQRLDAVLDEVFHQIDLGVETTVLREDAKRARELMAERLSEIAADPEGGHVYLAGHTHIDTAYLWPIRETVRKCSRTFATAVRLMELYPEFHFSCSQAQLFAFTKEHYPELYEQIRGRVAEGRWHTTGAMWVESDCNVPSGESLVRQFLHGLRFYREEFGTRPLSCWLPDVFGYPGNLPQILAGCGLRYFMTCKLHWQATNPFPYHLFRWRGIDGSDVIAHIPKLKSYYNGYPNPEQLTMAWEGYNQKCEHPEVLLPFGYGDGGGGVTAEMLEFSRRAQGFPGLPGVRHGGEEEFFAGAEADAGKLPVWDGELYLETHRGTLTSQSRTKVANRRAECDLRDAEVWAAIATALGKTVDCGPLRGAWDRVLLQQFHDILPGSSVHEVYDDAPCDYAEARASAQAVRDAALRALAGESGGPYCICNSLSWNRTDPVEISLPTDVSG
ncbi:MAG: hypothetical protein HON70_04645, partial [Lentisphaerae bacterium]|nr:hypothetical protein [Lentisphaerota bacterium]